jgi:hypothetical protein
MTNAIGLLGKSPPSPACHPHTGGVSEQQALRVTEQDWRARFSETFPAPASAVEARIWGHVYGEEYPAAVDPYNYVSVSERAGHPDRRDSRALPN